MGRAVPAPARRSPSRSGRFSTQLETAGTGESGMEVETAVDAMGMAPWIGRIVPIPGDGDFPRWPRRYGARDSGSAPSPRCDPRRRWR